MRSLTRLRRLNKRTLVLVASLTLRRGPSGTLRLLTREGGRAWPPETPVQKYHQPSSTGASCRARTGLFELELLSFPLREKLGEPVFTCPVDEHCGEDLVELFEKVRCERGLPLVLALVNGGAEKSETLARFFVEHQVTALHNVPRTPEHNAWIERAHHELKRGLNVGKKLPVVQQQPLSAWSDAVESMRRVLSEALLRVCLGGRTSMEARQHAPAPYDRETRARYYAAICAALECALANLTGLRATHPARRKAEREAIWMSMEAFGLIERTRGEAARRGAEYDIVA